ncbi:MAG: DUF3772 domain-containing protein, partial [Pseudomonadota bacterium]
MMRVMRFPVLAPSLWALLLAAMLACLPGGAVAQVQQNYDQLYEIWSRDTSVAETALDQGASTPALELLRERLVALRLEAAEVEAEADARLGPLRVQLEQIGPPPEEGRIEAPEVTERRRELAERVAAAEVPLLRAGEARQQAATLIARIDTVLRERFSEELITMGPSPVDPTLWPGVLADLGHYLARLREETMGRYADPVDREMRGSRVPLILTMILGGILIAVWLRRAIVGALTRRLERAESHRQWYYILISLVRLALPLAGAGLVLAAIAASELYGERGEILLESLPFSVLALVGAYWLGQTLFSPRTPSLGAMQVAERNAAPAFRQTLAAGAILAVDLLAFPRFGPSVLLPETQAFLNFILVALGAIVLFRLGWLLLPPPLEVEPGEEDEETPPEALSRTTRRFVARVSILLALLVPIFAAAGYFALARFLFVPWLLTLALLGFVLIFFSLIRDTVEGWIAAGTEGRRERFRIVPIFTGFVLVMAGTPVLALIWGAGLTDLRDAWLLMVEGFEIGETRLSPVDVLGFLVVFGIGYTLTRLFQGVMRNTVLPQMRMDAGGRNAVVSGIGYVGFFLSA